ncbi:MAG: molybdopterin-dependent oxidoreductase [Dehalococcoidales bacterium]|nr:molybdopterin-dependent oxidoreductase [Dehalococcoidales bacterium]
MEKENRLQEKQAVSRNSESEYSYPITLGFAPNSNSAVVDVRNGRIIRVRPLHFDWKYDKESFNPWKMEAHGKSFEPGMKALIPPYSLAYKKRVSSPNRILYPLKRIDWDPSSKRNAQNRGKSGYVRISWEEALELIAGEIKRVIDEYGPYSILAQMDGHGEMKTVHSAHGCGLRLLNLLGGYTLQTRNPDSWEGWYWGAKHVWGMEPVGQMGPDTNVMPDIAENSRLLLFWGCDPETTPWGFNGQMASRLCYWWSEIGIKSVYICPDLNYGAAIHADKWIPIRPGTDAALRLAIAYLWINEGTYDKEYVATHTYGFDKFEEYVLGKEDGIPKTPAWASGKTGIPEWTIKALARDWASKPATILHGNGGPGIRVPYATENGRLEVMLLGMQGLGKPGSHQVKMIEWNMHFRQPMPLSIASPFPGKANRGDYVPAVWDVSKGYGRDLRPDTIYPRQFIPKNLIHDALLKPPVSWYGTTLCLALTENQFTKYTYPAEGCPEVHMIWTDTPCWITCWNDSNNYIKALRSPKIEFILAQHPWMENDCQFADIVLPINTKFEEDDINSDSGNGQYRVVVNEKKCINSLGESVSDYEAVCLIAGKLGLLDKLTEGQTVQDLIKLGFETSGLEKMTTYEEFKEKGYFVVPTDPKWHEYKVGLRGFHDDPENNPLETPSGKLEYYSQNLAKYFPDDKERPPVPHWIEKGENHDESLSSRRADKFPLLIVSNHGRWRVHAQCDDITWTREAPTCKVKGPDGYYYEPLWINPADAAARGISSGDVAKVFNERGGVLGGAYVTERIMPGVVYMDHGARYDPIVPGELDRGGAINTITPHNITSKNATGMVVSGFLVEAERADIEKLRKRYPEAFERPYHAAAGLRMERVLSRDINSSSY